MVFVSDFPPEPTIIGFLAAGEQIYRFGERILAIRVELEVSSGRSKLNSKIVKEEQHFRREW